LICTGNTECIEDSYGTASCICSTGYEIDEISGQCERKKQQRPIGCEYRVCNEIEKCVEDTAGNATCVPDVPVAGCDLITCTTTNTKCVEDAYGNGMCVAIPPPTGCDAMICNGKSKCIEKANGKSVCICINKNFKYVNGKCIKK
jgi:hypothetical protein